jgi:hypothetical protein
MLQVQSTYCTVQYCTGIVLVFAVCTGVLIGHACIMYRRQVMIILFGRPIAPDNMVLNLHSYVQHSKSTVRTVATCTSNYL